MRVGQKLPQFLAALVIAASVGMVLPTTALAAPTSEPGAGVAIAPAAQRFFWEWSDGSDAKVRTFRASKYHTRENLPQLVVTAEPARPQQYVKLQYKLNGAWKREDAAATNGSGIARLQLNPICESGNWCQSTYSYRLLVNGIYTNFRITFAR